MIAVVKNNYFTSDLQTTTNGLVAINIHNCLPMNVMIDSTLIKPQETIRYRGLYGYGIPYGTVLTVYKQPNLEKVVYEQATIDYPTSDVYIV